MAASIRDGTDAEGYLASISSLRLLQHYSRACQRFELRGLASEEGEAPAGTSLMIAVTKGIGDQGNRRVSGAMGRCNALHSETL